MHERSVCTYIRDRVLSCDSCHYRQENPYPVHDSSNTLLQPSNMFSTQIVPLDTFSWFRDVIAHVLGSVRMLPTPVYRMPQSMHVRPVLGDDTSPGRPSSPDPPCCRVSGLQCAWMHFISNACIRVTVCVTSIHVSHA